MKTILSLSQIETRIEDVFSMSRLCGMTSAEENERVKTHIWDELNRKHGKRAVYSAWFCGYAAGLIAAARSANYAQHLEFCYVENDVKFSTHKASSHRSTEEFYSAGRGCELGSLPSGHFWKKSGKPYFVGASA